MAAGTNWCHIVLLSPVEIFRASLRDAWQRSRKPIVWACFVVACRSWMPSRRVVSATTSDMNWVPLSVSIVVVGRRVVS